MATEQTFPARAVAMPAGRKRLTHVLYAVVVALGALLFWLSERHPSWLPAWAPWDFSLPEYLAITLTLVWYLTGWVATTPEERPSAGRCTAFLLGMAVLWAVLQTRFEYWSQHMFFLNRIQHVVMHHLGPLLIALGNAGPTLKRGMPVSARKLAGSRAVAIGLRILQQPVLAAVLFVGTFYFWLIPAVHFRAMLDPRLYALMNWTMVLDGILFWCLVLDPRPKPPARVSFGGRMVLAIVVMFPQIVLGALISFAGRDLYPYYDLCGRIIPSIGALADQQIGGIVIWIPPAMMSVAAMLLVVNALRVHEDAIRETDDDASAMAALARRWTGV